MSEEGVCADCLCAEAEESGWQIEKPDKPLQDDNGRYFKVYLPDKAIAESMVGKLTDEQYEQFIELVCKGHDSQLDWDTIYNCATNEL